jgi:hypothetical protein
MKNIKNMTLYIDWLNMFNNKYLIKKDFYERYKNNFTKLRHKIKKYILFVRGRMCLSLK